MSYSIVNLFSENGFRLLVLAIIAPLLLGGTAHAGSTILDRFKPMGIAAPTEAAGSVGGYGIAGSGGGWTDGAKTFGSLFLVVLGLAARRVLLAALVRAARNVLALRRR